MRALVFDGVITIWYCIVLYCIVLYCIVLKTGCSTSMLFLIVYS